MFVRTKRSQLSPLFSQGITFLRDTSRIWRGLRPKKPFVAGLTINTICNLRCSYCFIGREAEHFPEGFAKQGLTGDKVKVLLSNIRKDTGLLIITGGEPLLHRNIEELLKYAKEDLRFLNISLATNAMLLKKKKACLPYIDRLGISYDLTRAREYPKEMEKMLEDLIELKKEKVLPPVHFTMTVIRNEDLGPLENFANFCKTNGFRIWVQPERDHGDFTEWDWYTSLVESFQNRFGKKLFLNDLEVVKRFANAKNARECLPELRIHVQEDGKLCYPCNKLEHLHQGGSVLDSTPMARWHEAIVEHGSFPNAACGDCGFTCYFETAGLYRRPMSFISKALANL